MNNDLISREALKKKLQARHDNGEEDFDKGYNIGIETAIDLIDNAPTVETDMDFAKECYAVGYEDGKTERPQGEWIKNEHTFWTCSHCNWFNEMNRIKYNFCPNCGADMKGGAE